MRFASSLSLNPDSLSAVREACLEAREQLNGATPDFAVIFFSTPHTPQADAMAALACDLLGTENLLGCSGESIVGVRREIEHEPAVSLWLASWPGVQSTSMLLSFERTPEGGVIQGWPDELAGDWPEGAFVLLLGEPFSFPVEQLLERMNEDRPGVPMIGGMASGGHDPGGNRLIRGRETFAEGAVAAIVHGPVRLDTVVSQGCRPIGKPFVVTKAERNVIHELGGKPALLQLKELFDQLPTREQILVQRYLHVGRVVSEYRDKFEQGDFLVRNVIGIDPGAGAIAIGDYIRTGQTVQFHVRDQEAADGELKQLLCAARKADKTEPAAALLFSCNGRGTNMFSQPDHDALAIDRSLGSLPLAGFFAQGEIGPIGGQNFMHGFTASIAIFRPR
jgi:small ligand-binding sensory domain FIST